LLIEQLEEVFVDHLVGAEVLVSHTTYFVSGVGLGDLNGELIQILLLDLAREIDEYKVVEVPLAVVGDRLEVLLRRLYQVDNWQARTGVSLRLDARMHDNIAVSQIADLEDGRYQALGSLVVDEHLQFEEHLLEVDAFSTHANLLIILVIVEVIEIVIVDQVLAIHLLRARLLLLGSSPLLPLVLLGAEVQYGAQYGLLTGDQVHFVLGLRRATWTRLLEEGIIIVIKERQLTARSIIRKCRIRSSRCTVAVHYAIAFFELKINDLNKCTVGIITFKR